MQRTGLNPPMDIVYAILEAIDVDKSGDIARAPAAGCWNALGEMFALIIGVF